MMAPTTRTIVIAALTALLPAAAAHGQVTSDAVASPPVPRDRPWLGARYDVDAVSGLEAWHELAVESASPVGDAMLILRARGARRFGADGTQLEAEAYPRLGRRTYLYLGAAASGSTTVYPRARFAAEAYRALPRAWEGSLGARLVRAPGIDLTTWTGTVGRYVGDYWLSARPSVTVFGGESALALGGTARRYFSGRYDYLSLSGGVSAGPDPEATDPQRLARPGDLHAWNVRVERLQAVGRSLRLRYGAAFEREELLAGGTRRHRAVVLGLDWVR